MLTSFLMKYLAFLSVFCLFACTPDNTEQERELVSRLRSSSDLATVEMIFSKVVKGKKTSTFLGFETGYSDFLAETEAHAKAGIDLSQVQVHRVDWEAGSIQILLPPPRIISLEIPAESFRINEEYTRDHYFSELTGEDMDNFYRQAEVEVRQEVGRMNLEAMVKEKTELFLRQFLSNAGFFNVTFSYQDVSGES